MNGKEEDENQAREVKYRNKVVGNLYKEKVRVRSPRSQFVINGEQIKDKKYT